MQAVRFAAAALALAWATAASAQLFSDSEARRNIEVLRKEIEQQRNAIDERLQKIEGASADRRSILDLAGQVEGLRSDMARLNGQIELLLHQVENADKRQKDLYLDIDTRLRKLEQAREQAAAPDKPPAGDGTPSAAETKAYEAALNQFKLGNYPLAVSAFQGFLVTYPSSSLAPSAQYWIGNAHYAQRDYKGAIAAQQKLIAAWPDNAKTPDAMLNIASSQEALGDRKGAARTLEGLLAKFPASPAAASAKQRLAAPAKR